MSDADYIKPGERDWKRQTRCWKASHAVGDDVMRELASALRSVCKYGEPRYASDALARYDRIGGK